MPTGSQTADATSKPVWRDRLYAGRNRLLAHPRFQRWASTFPFTRPIAKKRSGDLFDLCAGFVYSQILFACVELKLFESLSAGPMAATVLALRNGLNEEAMRRLLDAAAALRLVEKRDGLYGLGVHGAAALGHPGIGAMIAHHAMFYRDLADPIALLKGEVADTELARFWPYAGTDAPHALGAASVDAYSALMSVSQAMIADDVLDAYPFVDHACLMDVGGGGGDFLVAAAERRPDLRLVLFDLPAVAARAEARFARERLSARATALGGDFKRDPLPAVADLISLVRVAHDLADEALDTLLAKVFDALPPGGILLLAEPMAETAGAEKVGAYFAMYLLAMRQGRPRTVADLSHRLYRAGFARVRDMATPRPMLTSLIIAQKSAGRAIELLGQIDSCKCQSKMTLRGCDIGSSNREVAMQTAAIVLEQPRHIAVRHLDLTAAGASDIVVAIDHSAISTGTERLLYTGAMPAFPGMGYPLVPGYEAVGRVIRADAAGTMAIGQRVFVPGANCFADARGLFGASASHLVLPAARAMLIDGRLGEEAVLLALAATAHHTFAGYAHPDLIVGHGTLGRLLARLVIATGGAAPTVWEIDAIRAGGAQGYDVVHPDADPRRDYRAIVDVSGDAAVLDTLIGRLAPGGEVCLAGFYAKPLSFAFPPAFMREARLRVAAQWQRADLEAVTRLAATGAVSFADLITHRAKAQDATRAYATAFGDASCLKMVLDWSCV